MKRLGLIGVSAMLLPLGSGCGGDDALVTPGISAEIRDASTGTPAWYEATLTVRDGDYVETVEGSRKGSEDFRDSGGVVLLWAAEMRPGTYDVTVTHPGYQTWHQEGVRVTTEGSNPFDNSPMTKTVHLVVELEPIDAGS